MSTPWHRASCGGRFFVSGASLPYHHYFAYLSPVSFYYPRQVLAFGYCRCMRLCVRPSVCGSIPNSSRLIFNWWGSWEQSHQIHLLFGAEYWSGQPKLYRRLTLFLFIFVINFILLLSENEIYKQHKKHLVWLSLTFWVSNSSCTTFSKTGKYLLIPSVTCTGDIIETFVTNTDCIRHILY